jgi:potassium-transporting ATPase KdpC subunit
MSVAAGRAPPARTVPSAPAPPTPRAPRAHSWGGHLRAAAVLLIFALLVSGFAYPLFVTGVAQLIDPGAANGSLIRDANGTIIGSQLVAQNTDAPWLFWERPSLTDWNTTLGAESPPGPTDPALAALLNETIAYMREYGNFTVNATLPFWLVSPSASDIDPDLTPQAVLVQVPRVANASHLSVAFVTGLVNGHVTEPPIPYVGVPYVNVLDLDVALLPFEGR